MKKIVSLILILAMCFCTIFTVSASSPETTETFTQEVVVTASADEPMPIYSRTPAACGGEISNYYGELTCDLFSRISHGWIQAGVSSSDVAGNVDCGVILPNGTYQDLGSVPASGGSTPLVSFYGLAPGTYTFVFESSTSASIYVTGYIYE